MIARDFTDMYIQTTTEGVQHPRESAHTLVKSQACSCHIIYVPLSKAVYTISRIYQDITTLQVRYLTTWLHSKTLLYWSRIPKTGERQWLRMQAIILYYVRSRDETISLGTLVPNRRD